MTSLLVSVLDHIYSERVECWKSFNEPRHHLVLFLATIKCNHDDRSPKLLFFDTTRFQFTRCFTLTSLDVHVEMELQKSQLYVSLDETGQYVGVQCGRGEHTFAPITNENTLIFENFEDFDHACFSSSLLHQVKAGKPSWLIVPDHIQSPFLEESIHDRMGQSWHFTIHWNSSFTISALLTSHNFNMNIPVLSLTSKHKQYLTCSPEGDSILIQAESHNKDLPFRQLVNTKTKTIHSLNMLRNHQILLSQSLSLNTPWIVTQSSHPNYFFTLHDKKDGHTLITQIKIPIQHKKDSLHLLPGGLIMRIEAQTINGQHAFIIHSTLHIHEKQTIIHVFNTFCCQHLLYKSQLLRDLFLYLYP